MTRLRIAPESLARLRAWVTDLCLKGRGQRLERTIEQLGPVLDAHRARKSSVNGRGPWWNAGAKHMVAAMPPKHLANMGLVSLVDIHQRLQRFT